MKSVEEIRENIRAIISEVSEIEKIPDDASFKELGIDSMTAIEIITEVERTYKLSIPEQELAELTSFGKVVELVQAKLGQAPAGKIPSAA